MKAYLAKTVLAAAIISSAGFAQAIAPDWKDAKPVDIVLSNFSFAPETLQLRRGQAYRLHFINDGSGGHNFSAPDFFSRAEIDPADATAVSKGRVELHKGETRDVRLVPAAGTYRVKCTHFLHSGFGMKGQIVVN